MYGGHIMCPILIKYVLALALFVQLTPHLHNLDFRSDQCLWIV